MLLEIQIDTISSGLEMILVNTNRIDTVKKYGHGCHIFLRDKVFYTPLSYDMLKVKIDELQGGGLWALNK